MKILIQTVVQQHYVKTYEQFDENLFKTLKPPFPPVTLERFDGSQTGDEVHLRLNFFFFQQNWNAKIIEHGEKKNELYFIDVGSKLPFFLKDWRHYHGVQDIGNGQQTMIIDDIDYKTPFWWLDYLMYPVMYLQFWMRKPIYKKYFSSSS
jgi:ligand-binding SRPBCC domain-containing protein